MPLRPFSLYLLINRRKTGQNRRPSPSQTLWKRLWLGSALLFCLLLMSAVVAAGLMYVNMSRDLPSLEMLPLLMDARHGLLLQPTRLYDRTGQHLLLSLENPGINRRFLSTDLSASSHFSPILLQTAISLMEPDFWDSPGFDWLHLDQPAPATIAEHVANDLLLSSEPAGLRHTLRMRLVAAQITSRFGLARNADGGGDLDGLCHESS